MVSKNATTKFLNLSINS